MANSPITAGPSIRYGWESVKKQLWFFVGVTFVSMAIGSIGSKANSSTTLDIVGFLASTWMTCGTTMIYLLSRRGQKPAMATLFTSIDQYLPVLGATMLIGLIVGLGLVLLIFPGIYWAIKYQFVVPLIIDKKLAVFEAMKRSDAMTKGRKMDIFVFDLTMFGVIILGVLALGVGVLVALPVVGLAGIDLYQKLLEEKEATPTSPATSVPAAA